MNSDTLVVPIDEVVTETRDDDAQQQIVVVQTTTTNPENTTNIQQQQQQPKTVIVSEEAIKEVEVEELGFEVKVENEESEDPHVVVESILPDGGGASGGANTPVLEECATEVVLEEAANSSLECDGVVANGGGIGSDFFMGGADDETVIQLKEEEVIETPENVESAEMAVAMEMAKLSQQGQFVTNGDYVEYMGNSMSSNHSDSENTTPPPQIPGLTETPKGEKPRLSYAQMIAEALMAKEDRMLTLSEIYSAINRNHPYYSMDTKSWQNAIRHNLTLNPSFKKVPRPNNEGRGNYWKMEDGAEKVIFRRQIRSQQAKERKANQAAVAAQHRKQKQQPTNQLPTKQYVVNDDGTVVETTVVYPPATSTVISNSSPGQAIQILQPQQTQVLQNIEPSQIVQQNGSIVFIALPATKV